MEHNFHDALVVSRVAVYESAARQQSCLILQSKIGIRMFLLSILFLQSLKMRFRYTTSKLVEW